MPKGFNLSDPRRTTRKEVLKLKLAGLNGEQVAAALGISPQRVSQLVKALKESGDLPKGNAA